jgi:hypothetical protein
MRKRILLAVAVLLVPCAAGRGADPVPSDGQLALAYYGIAEASTETVQARIAAIDQLGKLGPKVPVAVLALRGFLHTPPPDMAKNETLMQSVVKALGSCGPAAREALPDLVKAISTYPKLSKDIEDALALIGKPAQPAQPPQDDVKALLKDLGDKDPIKRSKAAGALGDKANVLNVSTVLPPLLEAMNDPVTDVRRPAAESAKKALDVAKKALDADKTAPPEYTKWRQGYVDGLGYMLGEKMDTNERAFAAEALGEIDPAPANVPTALLKAASDAEKDAKVKEAATKAIKKIQGKK